MANAVDLIVTTWPRNLHRVEYLDCTLAALRRHLTFEAGQLNWLCSSETAQLDAAADKRQREVCEKHEVPLIYRPGQRIGLGGHLNWLIARTKCPFVFYVQDDWELMRDLDLSSGVRLMQSTTNLRYIRYFWHRHRLRGADTIPLAAGFSQAPHSFVDQYSHNPYLASREFFRQVGPFLDNLNAKNEQKMNALVQQRRIPVGLVEDTFFQHVGTISTLADRRLVRLKSRIKLTSDFYRQIGGGEVYPRALNDHVAELYCQYLPQSILELGSGPMTLIGRRYRGKQAWHPSLLWVVLEGNGEYAERSQELLGDITFAPLDPVNCSFDFASLEAAGLCPRQAFDFIMVGEFFNGRKSAAEAAWPAVLTRIGAQSCIIIGNVQDPSRNALLELIQNQRRGHYNIKQFADSATGLRGVSLVPKQLKSATLPSS